MLSRKFLINRSDSLISDTVKRTKSLNILSLLQVVGHPRDSKRIDMLKSAGFNISALAFHRDYHEGRMPNCSVKSLGRIENGKYLKRAFKILFALPKIRRIAKKYDVIYASGQDMAAMAKIATAGLKIPIVLEVGDIVDMQLSQNFLGYIVRKVEAILVNSYQLLIVISPGFLEDYYRKRLSVKIPALVLENKLESSTVNYNFPEVQQKLFGLPFIDRPLKIGYFGLLRDEWSWNVLRMLVETYPNRYQVLFAGKQIVPANLLDEVKFRSGMEYFGEYESPKDLKELYESVDMIWACYAPIGENDWNLKWGRPNRFFESCFFKRPVFARYGAHFNNDVEKYKIGKTINKAELEDVIDEVNSITLDQLTGWKNNIEQLSEQVYLYGRESLSLATEISNLRRNK